jgi:hypothetical protein
VGYSEGALPIGNLLGGDVVRQLFDVLATKLNADNPSAIVGYDVKGGGRLIFSVTLAKTKEPDEPEVVGWLGTPADVSNLPVPKFKARVEQAMKRPGFWLSIMPAEECN